MQRFCIFAKSEVRPKAQVRGLAGGFQAPAHNAGLKTRRPWLWVGASYTHTPHPLVQATPSPTCSPVQDAVRRHLTAPLDSGHFLRHSGRVTTPEALPTCLAWLVRPGPASLELWDQTRSLGEESPLPIRCPNYKIRTSCMTANFFLFLFYFVISEGN